ncbi:MAG: 16S rRNA (adenine(1518)-N(6)/adenine(1519)-N(6)) -dimethyltransferase RsmA [Vulcanimicrobiaceae bacterium]
MGQNFLMDGGAVKRIAVLCVAPPTTRVLEIGPGTGALTVGLVALGASVTAVEVDPDMVAILRSRPELAHATLEEGDALAYDYDGYARSGAWCAAGNLPYNIATPLLTMWLTLPTPPARIVVMVQREVAERLVAIPSSPAYGSLTVFCRYFAAVRRAFVLGPSVFYPRPNVDSAVVVLEPHAVAPVAMRDRAFFLQVVRAGFAYRRKTLANSLLLALDLERARTQTALAALDIDSEIRAEQLDLGAFGALADILAP